MSQFDGAVDSSPDHAVQAAVEGSIPEYEYIKDILIALDAKEEGNNLFRNKQYDEALEFYSKAITYCPEDDENKENLATFYGNRSAAYFTLDEHELVVEDCTAALQLKPDYVKVLARRMLSYETREIRGSAYRFAPWSDDICATLHHGLNNVCVCLHVCCRCQIGTGQ